MKKALVFCSSGLGDGLLFLIISYNLFKNGYLVDTYHPFLSQMSRWFKYTNIKPYPQDEKFFFESLKNYDLIVINSDYNLLNKKILSYSKQNFPSKTYELHPSTCKGRNGFLGDLKFDFTKSIMHSLSSFCKKNLNIKNVILSNGIAIPDNLEYRKYEKRVIIHPSSKDIEKNWPKKKFQDLCKKLKNFGFLPYLILKDVERKYFEDIKFCEKPNFQNISEVARFIFESGYMIGNDSGIAHLASNLKIPSLVIFSTKRKEIFWKPNFYLTKTVVSWPLINIKGLRLREKYWKKTISSKKVFKNFKRLIKDNDKYEHSDI